MNRTKPISKGTLKYLNSALAFFKKKHGLDSINCEVKFIRHRDTLLLKRYFKNIITLGYYNIDSNEVVIEGCDYHPRNQLVKTLFHELTHYWQVKIVQKLKPVFQFGNQQVDTLFSDQSLIKDAYHCYPTCREVYYDKVRTDNMIYWDRPQEIEARKVSQELFDEWNLPENKGKNV